MMIILIPPLNKNSMFDINITDLPSTTSIIFLIIFGICFLCSLIFHSKVLLIISIILFVLSVIVEFLNQLKGN